jgi:hypothetical protein
MIKSKSSFKLVEESITQQVRRVQYGVDVGADLSPESDFMGSAAQGDRFQGL